MGDCGLAFSGIRALFLDTLVLLILTWKNRLNGHPCIWRVCSAAFSQRLVRREWFSTAVDSIARVSRRFGIPAMLLLCDLPATVVGIGGAIGLTTVFSMVPIAVFAIALRMRGIVPAFRLALVTVVMVDTIGLFGSLYPVGSPLRT